MGRPNAYGFPNIFKPGRIGKCEIKNRVVMAPISTNFASAEGDPTDELIAFYRERAIGGVGLLILECANVDFPLGKTGHTQMRFDDDKYIPKLHELAEILHEAGCKVMPQISHTGGLFGDRSREAMRPIAPSPFLYGKRMVEAKEATVEEISHIRDCFINAAYRAWMADFDGVEIHGAHGYLLAEFLSPWTNQRCDEYGGNVENRARLALEIVEGIKKKLPDFPIVFRISGDEFVSCERGLPEEFEVLKLEREKERMLQGRGLQETIEIVKMLKDAGVDCIHVTAGTHRLPHTAARRAQVEPMGYEQGWKAYLSCAIRKECSITTITVGVVRDHAVAEGILERGEADFVALGRGLIADPRWVLRIKDGSRVRRCISCNGCVQYRSSYGWKLRCSVNAAAGREYRLDSCGFTKVSEAKRILVVGGGPGGMEAARVASLRGHEVTLVEKRDVLGGNLLPAGALKEKLKINWFKEWLEEEVVANGVKIVTGTNALCSDFDAEPYDAVVVASGAEPDLGRIPDVEDGCGISIRQAVDLLRESGTVDLKRQVNAKKALVLGGGLIGCEAALFMARLGACVSVMTRRERDSLASDMDPVNRYDILVHMFELGIHVIDHAKIVKIGKSGVIYTRYGEEATEPCDSVILAQGFKSNLSAFDTFTSRFDDVLNVGDCVSPRNILSAVYEGFMAGCKI
jgi:2,4-dienoyl-CoA reductase-like NADH-dependent reductase (Old Yellow Enzyme family)/thioredoxin reductase